MSYSRERASFVINERMGTMRERTESSIRWIEKSLADVKRGLATNEDVASTLANMARLAAEAAETAGAAEAYKRVLPLIVEDEEAGG